MGSDWYDPSEVFGREVKRQRLLIRAREVLRDIEVFEGEGYDGFHYSRAMDAYLSIASSSAYDWHAHTVQDEMNLGSVEFHRDAAINSFSNRKGLNKDKVRWLLDAERVARRLEGYPP